MSGLIEFKSRLATIKVRSNTSPLEFVERVARKLVGSGAGLLDESVETLTFMFLKGSDPNAESGTFTLRRSAVAWAPPFPGMSNDLVAGIGHRGEHILYGLSVTCVRYLLYFVDDDNDELGFKEMYNEYETYGYLGALGTNGEPGKNRVSGDLLWLLLN